MLNRTLLALPFLLGACAFEPHAVSIAAKAPQDGAPVGQGVSLALEVLDDRESQVVGQRGAGMRGADITAPTLITVVERELAAGFRARGFEVLPANAPSDVEVEARVRAFRFFIETGFWTGAENTDVVIALEAERGLDDFDRTYRSSEEDLAQFVPDSAEIDEMMNRALSDVFRQIMTDDALMEFLVRPRDDVPQG